MVPDNKFELIISSKQNYNEFIFKNITFFKVSSLEIHAIHLMITLILFLSILHSLSSKL